MRLRGCGTVTQYTFLTAASSFLIRGSACGCFPVNRRRERAGAMINNTKRDAYGGNCDYRPRCWRNMHTSTRERLRVCSRSWLHEYTDTYIVLAAAAWLEACCNLVGCPENASKHMVEQDRRNRSTPLLGMRRGNHISSVTNH